MVVGPPVQPVGAHPDERELRSKAICVSPTLKIARVSPIPPITASIAVGLVLDMSVSESAVRQGELGWLEAIHQQWVATLDALRDAIVVVDAGGQVLRANTRFAELVGCGVKRVRGRQIDTLAPWLVDSAGRIAEQPRRSPGGKIVFARICPMDGRLEGRVYILDDVTAENALAEAERKFIEGEAQSYGNVIESLLEAQSQRDPYTAQHGRNVATLSRAIALALGHDDIAAQGIYYAALIHDIGKLSIPGSILNKPGTLAQAELNLIQMHPQTGFTIVKSLDFPWPVRDIILQHHERLDGSGYPEGLAGSAIADEARIVSVADVVEAMSSHRPYRPSRGLQAAVDEIRSGRDTLYDKRVVDACLEVLGDGIDFGGDQWHIRSGA